MSSVKENNTPQQLSSPSGIKPPLKLPPSGSLIPKPPLLSSIPILETDKSQILLSPQFKKQNYHKEQISSISNSSTNTSARSSDNALTKVMAFYPSPPILLSTKNKRAKWDTKGLLDDAFEDLKTYKIEYNKLAEEYKLVIGKMDELEQIASSLDNAVKGTTNEKLSLKEKLELMESTLKMNEEKYGAKIEKITTEFNEKLSVSKDNNANLSRSLELSRQELELCNIEISKLRQLIEAQSTSLVVLENAKTSLTNLISELKEKDLRNESKISTLELEISQLRRLVSELKNDAIEGEKIRKRLHNEVQELKGNIRVFCRVRPPLPDVEESTLSTCPQEAGNVQIGFSTDPISKAECIELTQWIDSTSGSTKPQQKSFPFTFDRVFGPTASQNQVFEDISQLVQSVLDGYRVCIFAYGQTGSGKTFTMEGPAHNSDPTLAGMIPRAVAQIFETAEEHSIKLNWKFSMEASFLEIYNETLQDLLSSEEDNKKLEIRHNSITGKTSVSELTIVPVTSISQVNRLLKKASENRSIGETKCNERSSRSHSVFTLAINGENLSTGEKLEGILNLIDLAGSERLSVSGATGDRLKETQSINKSLSALGDVIMALGRWLSNL